MKKPDLSPTLKTVLSYLLALCIVGVLVYLITGHPLTVFTLEIALLLTLNPLFIFVLYAILRVFKIGGNGVFHKVYRFIEQTVNGVKESMTDWNLALQTLVLNVIHLFVTCLFVYTGGKALSIELTFIQVMILATVVKLSQILKNNTGESWRRTIGFRFDRERIRWRQPVR